jgi:hypothetical protein
VDPSKLGSSATAEVLAANQSNLEQAADKLMANVAASVEAAKPTVRELAHRLQVRCR